MTIAYHRRAMGDRRRGALTVVLIVAVSSAVAAFYSGPIAVDQYGDFEAHIETATKMVATRQILVPHFVFHLSAMLVSSLLEVAPRTAAIGLTSAAEGITCLALICLLRYGQRLLGLSRPLSTETALLAGFALSFVGPLSLVSFPNLALGYPAISVAHSPTIILLRPLAVGLFIVTLRLLTLRSWGQWWGLAAAALTLALVGNLTKPSYNVCLLPALAVALFRRFRQAKSLPGPTIATFALLAVTISAATLWQVKFLYGPGTDAGVTFAPLRVLNYWNKGSSLVTIAKLGLGLAFPLFVAAAYRKAEACASDAFRLSWLATLMAVASAYLLSETGRTAMHGNLAWSLQICLLILMTVSVAVFLSEENGWDRSEAERVSGKALIGTVLFLLHFFSGLGYIILAPRVS